MDQVLVSRAVERRRKRRRGLVLLLGSLAIGSLGAASMSLAIFTDTATADWDFTAGTIDINAVETAVVDVPNMMPGDVEVGTLTVENNGTGDLRYATTVTATGSLGDQLQLTIREEDADGGCDDLDGAVVTGPAALDGTTVGNPATLAQAGDRFLAAGTNEVLCLRVDLPLSTNNTFQGASSTATFTFDAEQTANNP
jgi:hypothetical protein